MVFPILGSGIEPAAYNIDNSSCFGGTGTFLTRSQSSSEDSTARRKFTISLWTKQTLGGSASGWNGLWSAMVDSNNLTSLKINGDEQLIFEQKLSGSNVAFTSDMVFKDPAAWYNIVVAYDSTDGTANDRVKVYVNGSQITGTYGTFVQNESSFWGDNTAAGRVGAYGNNTGDAYMINGYIADACCTIGYALTPSSFGKTDPDSGIWIPKNPGVTYSANGFFLEFKQSGTGADASGIGADTSGNTNHFTIDSSAGTIFQTTDSPTNNFATLNPLMGGRGSTLTEGNLKVSGESDNNYDVATFGSDMKWYYEWKVDDNYDGAGGGIRLGALHEDELETNDNFPSFANATAKFYTNSNDGKTQDGNGDNESTGLTRATTNDIIMCACDGANAKIWWGINGTWLDYGAGTGNPAAGTNAETWSTAMQSGIWFPTSVYSGTAAGGQLNLGNPTFTISSGNADDAGYGNFEYDVPTGFYALCSKNLALYGG